MTLRLTRAVLVTVAAALIGSLAACTTPALREDAGRPVPSYAAAPASTGILAEVAARIERDHGPDYSGFSLLDGSHEALTWRLAMIDSATSSLDIMTYLWYPDASGKLILERALRAAQRGVRVRLVVDDLLTAGQDQVLRNIQQWGNIELRLFNPWTQRDLGSRAGEAIAQMERLNSRMHDKLLIADGRAAIVGGRNIGDHYFGLSPAYNFHDLDLLAIGELARDAGNMFDHFWNSEWVASAESLTVSPDREQADAGWANLQLQNRREDRLRSFAREPKDWAADFRTLESSLRPGTGKVIYDEISAGEIQQSMLGRMFAFFQQAQSELFITNAYIIPGERGIGMLEELGARGVDVRILTNSLASHDVPAVNSHYEPWRGRIIAAGAELHELRADAAIQQIVDVPPVSAKFVGLHTKAAVVDRRHVFIGSMNLDPRSAAINTEMGAMIDSPGLAEDLRRIMLRDMSGANAWRVSVADNGSLRWTNDDETVSSQPTRGFMQGVMNLIFKVVPAEQF